MTPEERSDHHLRLAREQVGRVQAAGLEPVDWSDLTIYGLLALENAVVAAAEHLRLSWKANHYNKAELASRLSTDYGLPDVEDMLRRLNAARKSESYGDGPLDRDLDAEDVAMVVENYIEQVEALLNENNNV